MANSETAEFVRGYAKALREYGTVCGSQANCSECPIGRQLAEGIDCTEYMRKFPEQFANILSTINKRPLTYFEVYCLRFPVNRMGLTDTAEMLCRKAIFEGTAQCDSGDCRACWNEPYDGES